MMKTMTRMAAVIMVALWATQAQGQELTEMEQWVAKPGSEVESLVQATQNDEDGTWRVPTENMIMKQVDADWWFVLNVSNCWIYYVKAATPAEVFYNYTANTNSYGFNFQGRETEIAALKKRYGIIPTVGTGGHTR